MDNATAGKDRVWSRPRRSGHWNRIFKGLAGSCLLHILTCGIGFSLILQANKPIIEPEDHSFRWKVSMVSAPSPDPVVSETPSPALSAPPPVNAPAPVRPDSSPAATPFPKKSKERSARSQEKASSHSLIASVSQKKSFREKKTAGQPMQQGTAGSRQPYRSLANQIQLTRDTTQPVPFTTGLQSTLPPPSPHIHPPDRFHQPHLLKLPEVRHRPTPVHRTVHRVETRPDYGWLIDDLRTKLEQLKYYPRIARQNKWEGKVIIQMTILDGGHMVDMEIEESSGFEVLDETAMTILQMASPMDLDHPLASKQVVLSIPLTFQLE